MAFNRADAKTSQSTARLIITGDGGESWLEARSFKKDADLVLDGKGDGIVRVGDSEVLTMDSLGNLDELAAALAGITIEGADPATVIALEALVNNLLSNLAHIDGTTPKPATVERAVALLKGMYVEIVQAADSLNELVWGLAQKPGGPASVAQAVTAVWAAINAAAGVDEAAVNALIAAALAALPDAGIDEAAVKALIGATLATMIMPILDGHTTDIAGLDTRLTAVQALVANLVNEIGAIVVSGGEPLAQQLIDIIGGKPQGGGSIADVAATFAALGQALIGAVGIEEAAVNALIQAALADLGAAGLDEAAVIALLEEKLTEFGPMIIMAVQSQMTAMPDRIRLNVKDASPGAKVVIEALNLTATNAIPNPVSMDIEVPGGTLSVNGKRVATVQEVGLLNALVENLYDAITGGVEQINGATGEPVNHTIIVANWLLNLPVQIANAEANVMAFGDNVMLLSATKADQAEFLALKAAVAALGSGSGGAGLTGEQAQLLINTAADLNALITGITGIFTTSPSPDGVVNTIRRIAGDADKGAKLASAFLAGFLGKPIMQLGSNEQEALQAIVDWCAGFVRRIEGSESAILGLGTDLEIAQTNIVDLAEAVIQLQIDLAAGSGGSFSEDLNTFLEGVAALRNRPYNGVADSLNVMSSISLDADGGVKIAQALVKGLTGAMPFQLGANEAAIMQAIIDWCAGFVRRVEGSESNILGLRTDLEAAQTNIADLAEAVIPLISTVETHGERITTLEGAALGGGSGGVSQTVVDSLVARLNALESENARLKRQVDALEGNVGEVYARVEDIEAIKLPEKADQEDLDALAAKKADKSALSATDLRVQSISDTNSFLQNNLVLLSEDVKDKADKTELASYATKAELEPVAELAALAAAETQRLELQDQEIVQWIADTLVTQEYLDDLQGAIVNMFGKFGDDIAWNNVQIEGHDTLILSINDRIQRLMNAINGPTATVESIQEMFWLLSDVIEALITATGIQLPGRAAITENEE